MVLAGVIGASGWFYLANFAETPFEATAASIVASLGVAVSDVVADSIVVEKVSLRVLTKQVRYFRPPKFRVEIGGTRSGSAPSLLPGSHPLCDICSCSHQLKPTKTFNTIPHMSHRFSPSGEGFGFPSRCWWSSVVVLGQRGCGGNRQRLLLRSSSGTNGDEGGLLAYDVLTAINNVVCCFYRREAAN